MDYQLRSQKSFNCTQAHTTLLTLTLQIGDCLLACLFVFLSFIPLLFKTWTQISMKIPHISWLNYKNKRSVILLKFLDLQKWLICELINLNNIFKIPKLQAELHRTFDNSLFQSYHAVCCWLPLLFLQLMLIPKAHHYTQDCWKEKQIKSTWSLIVNL